MSDSSTVIQFVNGSDAGATRRTGLTAAQKAGDACLVCGEPEGLDATVGFVDGTPVKVHARHLTAWRTGATA